MVTPGFLGGYGTKHCAVRYMALGRELNLALNRDWERSCGG